MMEPIKTYPVFRHVLGFQCPDQHHRDPLPLSLTGPPFLVGVLLGITLSSFRVEVASFVGTEGVFGVAAFEVFSLTDGPFDSATDEADDFLGTLISVFSPFAVDVDLVELLLEVPLLLEVLLLAVDEVSSLS